MVLAIYVKGMTGAVEVRAREEGNFVEAVGNVVTRLCVVA